MVGFIGGTLSNLLASQAGQALNGLSKPARSEVLPSSTPRILPNRPFFGAGGWIIPDVLEVADNTNPTALGNTPADVGVGAIIEAPHVQHLDTIKLTGPIIPVAGTGGEFTDQTAPDTGLVPLEPQSLPALGLRGFDVFTGEQDMMRLVLFGLLAVGLVAAVKS